MTDNKQLLIHIASEVVVLVGLTFYFSRKNKTLKRHIEDLAQRVEDQEDLLQKHEQIIKRLCAMMNQQRNSQYRTVPKEKLQPKVVHESVTIPIQLSSTDISEENIVEKNNQELGTIIENNEDETLDREIRSELEELQANTDEDDDDIPDIKSEQ